MDLPPTTEPTTLRAGDSIGWVRDLPDYAVGEGWSLKYKLLFPSGPGREIFTTGAETRYTVDLTPAETAQYIAGPATLVAWVENAAARHTLGQKPVTILPDLTQIATFDARSQAEKGLADAKSALAAHMASGRAHVAEYEIVGRRMKFRSADEIRALIEYYQAEVGKERAALALLSGGSPGRVCTRM